MIEDQFPISYRKSIDVDRIDYVGAKLDDKTGMLLWDLELNANESKDVQFNYQVRYPKYPKYELLIAVMQLDDISASRIVL